MMITHHPSEMVLAEFANSVLDEAAALVVGAHISQCRDCQAAVHRLEMLGGAALDENEQLAPLSVSADDLLSRTDAMPEPAPSRRDVEAASPEPLNKTGVERLLSLYDDSIDGGKWRWIGPGVHWRPIRVPSDSGLRVFMLKARPGTALPHHKHSGIEWTTVLKGAFVHAHGRFGPGDFDEADSSMEHDPVVEMGDECICIVAMNGRLELQGIVGRLLQPFVRL